MSWARLWHQYSCAFIAPPQPGKECSVCLEDLKPPLEILPCGHIFHNPCIIQWLVDGNSLQCPLCRDNLSTELLNAYLDRAQSDSQEQASGARVQIQESDRARLITAGEAIVIKGVKHVRRSYQVPTNTVGWIIGKQGANIKRLQEETATKIDIQDRTTASSFTILHISGKTEGSVIEGERKLKSHVDAFYFKLAREARQKAGGKRR